MTGPDVSRTGEPAAPTRRDLVFVIVALVATTLLSALDQAIFSTALPTIVGDLGGVDEMLWVTTAYMLAITVTMPIYGKLGDLIGHKILFQVSLVLFIGGSILGGLSGSMAVLIIARAVQGLGGGGLIILAQAIIADIAPPRQRGTYMGVIGGCIAVASVLGPILGGWFTDSVGWRWAFWFNLPLGLFSLVIAIAFLRTPQHKTHRPQLDVLGIMTMTVWVTAVILLTSWGGREYAWGSTTILGLIAVAAVFAGLFLLAERKAVQPIIPLDLFRDRNFNLATIVGLISALAMFGILTYMPSYLQMVTDLSATKSGLMLVPMSVGILITSLGSGILTSRTGRYKWMPIVSCFAGGVGLYLISALTIESSLWTVGIYLFFFGAAQGLAVQILVLIVQNSFSISKVGTATAANNFFRQIGASLGSAAVGTVFTNRLMTRLTERLAGASDGLASALDPTSLTPALVAQLPEEAKHAVVTSYGEALTPIFFYIAPIMILAAALSFFIREKPLGTRNVVLDEQGVEAV